MKVTKEQLKAFSLKVEEATREILGATSMVLDSESIWIDTVGAKLRYPDLPRNFTVMHAGFEFDLFIKKEEE